MQRQLRSQTLRESTRIVGDNTVELFKLVDNISLHVHPKIGPPSINAIDKNKGLRSKVGKLVNEFANKTKRWVFSFGAEDVHRIFYHRMFKATKNKKKKYNPQKIARDYVKRVANFSFGDRSTIIVLGLYPSPCVTAEDILKSSCQKYKEEEKKAVLAYERQDNALENRQKRIRLLNKAIEAAVEEKCKELQKEGKNLNLQYCDVFDDMIDADTHLMLEMYRKDASSLDVVGETTINLWLEKWDWLRAMNA